MKFKYFAGILIESDLSLEDLNRYYEKYQVGDDKVKVTAMNTNNIELLDREHRFPEEDFKKDARYYLAYAWGSPASELLNFDMRAR